MGMMFYNRQTMLLLLAVVATLFSPSDAANTLFLRSCPVVDPVENFNMSRFEGRWYIHEVFDKAECMQWEIKPHAADIWSVKETMGSENPKELQGWIHATGETSPLKISWGANPMGRYPMYVYDVNYEEYAGVFMCQTVPLFSRRHGLIMSRSSYMHSSKIGELRGKLSRYDIDLEQFIRVRHAICGYDVTRPNPTMGLPEPDANDEEMVDDIGLVQI